MKNESKILIIEDDMLLNDMTKRLLTQHGYCTTSAYSGSEALLLIERSSFDLILLDLMLPGIIEIEDHGNGMSPQQQKQIFARNYTTARKSSGSGLGLAISKRLAEQIGAELEVYSIQNERTTFSIILKS